MGKLTFGATGLSYQVDKVTVSTSGAPLCPRCNDRVYFNEERRALQKSWHIKCFNCAKCKKKLDSTTFAAHEDEIYCRYCHKKEFGPKGYGFAGGAAGLSSDFKSQTSTSVPSAPKPPAPTSAGTSTVSSGLSAAPKVKIDRSDPNNCPRCGKKVYFAEELKALNKKFHRLCFKCGSCNKLLEPGRCSTHENDLYCNNCYGRKFGPKGYGFAGGSGTMMAPDIEKMKAGVQSSNGATETEVSQKRQDPVSRQQQEIVESRPKDLVNGVVYGASNSIFDSRREQRQMSGGSSPSDMQRRVSPMPQDQGNVVLVPHERTRFSPNITQEEVRKSPQTDQSWSNEEFRKSPIPQEQQDRNLPSPAFQDTNQRVNQISPSRPPPEQHNSYQEPIRQSPLLQEQRTSPAERNTSPRYGNSLHPNGAYYSPSGGSVEELSKYNDPSMRSQSLGQPGAGGPSPIDHLVSNMYTRSDYSGHQNSGYSYATGETAGPEMRSYQGSEMQRAHRSVEDLSEGRTGYVEPHYGAIHAKSASIDGSAAYSGVGSDAAVIAALGAARTEYGHVSAVPAYVSPTVPPSQPQYGHPTGGTFREYHPEPQYIKSDYGPQPPSGHTTYSQNDQYYNPQYQPRSVESAQMPGYTVKAPYGYENDYRTSNPPPSYNQIGNEAYSHSNAHGYRGQNENNFSSAVDAVFSATMPTVKHDPEEDTIPDGRTLLGRNNSREAIFV